jgi:hypothetical protein
VRWVILLCGVLIVSLAVSNGWLVYKLTVEK